MCAALNQLYDILEYVSFKELKADIIHQMSLTIHEYVRVKSHIGDEFFTVMPKVRTDISFKTMIGQYGDMEKTKTFMSKSFSVCSETLTYGKLKMDHLIWLHW